MPDNYTTSGRFLLMGTGENNNTWGNRQNVSVFQLMDDAVFGWVTKALTGDYSLTTADGGTSEARKRMFKFTGAGTFAVTAPSVSASYLVWNATTGVLTFTNGSVSVTVQVGEVVQIITDGSSAMKRVVATDFGGARITSVGAPTGNTDAATKKYVDDTAFAGMSGTFPGQPGNAGKFLKTDGATPEWEYVTATDVGVAGRHALWVPASAMIARTTNGAAGGLVETTTNKVMARTYDFDASTIEYVQFSIRMPKSWNEGTITFVPEWSHAATATNFGVSWGLQAVGISDDDTLDAAFGTALFSNDTGGTTNDLYTGPESAAITISGTPAAEDFVVFQVLRKADDGTNDTLAIDARLHGVTIYLATDAGNDA